MFLITALYDLFILRQIHIPCRNFINPDTTGLPEPMLDELQYDFGTGGNSNHTNEEINSFLAYFFKFYDLLKKNDLPRDIFDTAISDRLKTMEK